MTTSRIEAFSDGVIAIIITIMVLEMKVPHGSGWVALRPLVPVFGSYLMSFVYVGIYWNNHHHLMHTTKQVNGNIMWANLHLLFWLSLIPFVTGWMGTNGFGSLPTSLYGVVLLCAALAYQLLQTSIIACQGNGSRLQSAIGRDLKGKISLLSYFVAVPIAFWMPWISVTLYVLVAVMWFLPDRRL